MNSIQKFSCLLLLGLLGCGGNNTQMAQFGELVPVKGVVKRAGSPVSGGLITFESIPQSKDFTINGIVGQDGSFVLSTVRNNDSTGERKTGVAPGKYKVIYTPLLQDQTKDGHSEPEELPTQVTIAAGQPAVTIDLPAKKK